MGVKSTISIFLARCGLSRKSSSVSGERPFWEHLRLSGLSTPRALWRTPHSAFDARSGSCQLKRAALAQIPEPATGSGLVGPVTIRSLVDSGGAQIRGSQPPDHGKSLAYW
jgi:hypothetical protein